MLQKENTREALEKLHVLLIEVKKELPEKPHEAPKARVEEADLLGLVGLGEEEVKGETVEEKGKTEEDQEEKLRETIYGVFPRENDLEGQFKLASKELSRIHLLRQDYRQAYKLLKACMQRYPDDVHMNYRMGRLCLEVGRKREVGRRISNCFRRGGTSRKCINSWRSASKRSALLPNFSFCCSTRSRL